MVAVVVAMMKEEGGGDESCEFLTGGGGPYLEALGKRPKLELSAPDAVALELWGDLIGGGGVGRQSPTVRHRRAANMAAVELEVAAVTSSQ